MGNKLARAKRHFNVNNKMGNYFVTFSPSSSLCASSRHGDCQQTGALCRGDPLIKLTTFVVYTASRKKYFFTVRLLKPRMRHINRTDAKRHRHVDWRTFRIDGRRRWLLYQRRVIRRLAAARPILRLLQKNGEI